jgi:hypothetical protein
MRRLAARVRRLALAMAVLVGPIFAGVPAWAAG